MQILLGIEDAFTCLKQCEAQKSLLRTEQPKSEIEQEYERMLKRIQYAKQYWKAEKEQRIKSLLWWTPELVSKLNLPADARVWYIHPVAFVKNLNIQMKMNLKISQKGIDFIYSAEALPGISSKLHWPGGSSGITLGAGHDIKYRTKGNVINDLVTIGIKREVSERIAQGVGLKGGKEIKEFLNKNKSLISLTSIQEKQLLNYTLPKYEQIIDSKINIPLQQHEYDALVSFVYNIGSISQNLQSLLNQNKKMRQ